MARRSLGNMRTSVLTNVGNHSLATVVVANEILQQAFRDVNEGQRWSYRRRETAIQTVAPYSTGTVTVTSGSATLVGSGTTWTSAMVGRAIRVAGDPAYLFVAAVASATSLTLGDPQANSITWPGATAAAQTYSIFQHQYALPTDVDLVLLPNRNWPIIEKWRDFFDRLDPARTSTGDPIYYALVRNLYAAGQGATPGTPVLTGSTTTTAVPVAAVALTVALSAPDTTYQLIVTPSWNTGTWVTGKTTVQAVINFSVPAPSGASIDWQLSLTTTPQVPPVVESTIIEFWPVPSAAKLIRLPYLAVTPSLALDTDLPTCPSEPVECYATAKLADYLFAKTGDARWSALSDKFYTRLIGNPAYGIPGILQMALQDDEQKYGLPTSMSDGGMSIGYDQLASRDWAALW